jgi:N-acyl-D-aspartate/D-glutamate deacylase
MHDLLIRGAIIHDGSGMPGRPGALAIENGLIAAVGEDAGSARATVDADGLVLMPGIIDSHTHYDAQITWDPWLAPSPALGVTTAIIGNCGFTIAPCRPADRERTMRNLTQVEGMSFDVLRQGIAWEFETFPEYLAMIERRGAALNVAAFLGHSSVRTWAMGPAATARAAAPAEVAAMAEIVRAAMAAGAIGFATSTAGQHNGEGGVPMPSRLADDGELRTLVRAMGEHGRGIFMLTKGSHTSVPFLESLAADSGRPVMIAALLHNSTAPDGTFRDLDDIAAAQRRGRRLYGQVSCCPLTNDFTLRSAYPFEGFDAWKPAMKLQGDALKRLYADAGFRQRFKDELTRPAGVRLFNGEWHKIEVIEVARPENRTVEGQTVDRLAAAAGRHPLDWMLDFAIAEDLGTVFTAVLLNSDEAAVGRMLRHPHASIALSDAGAHLTFFCDAGFGLHLLGHWVRELGVLGFAEAVWQLTGRPAQIFGIPGRGLLRPGMAADLLLIDPDQVGRGPKRRVFDLPGGAPRLTTNAIGVRGVWVNGVRIVDENGPLLDAGRPGRVLRSFVG